YKAAANWMLGPVKSWLNENSAEISQFPVTPAALAALITLTDAGKVSFSIASSRILPEMIQSPADPMEIATRLNLLQDNNADNISPIIDEVLAKYPDKVAAFKGGKKGLMSLFVGEVMKLSKGKADPRLTNELLAEKLKG
ncbi:MAG TPA: Asp-tRNA(Asn)/Glu-tRNA(Gln) amidotransferase GatCAB subunit B, partial [Chitinophaga sp.]